MILRGAGRAIAGLALVAAVSACDDNPLSENRDSAEYFRLSVSNAVVEVGGQIGVVANVLNQYGAALVVNVTASECNAGVTVAVDTIRSEYEYPERFIITGNTVGESCVVVSGGGVTDTITVRVVPAAVDLMIADTLVGSGDVVPLTVAYQNTTGGAAAGIAFDPTHTTFAVRTAATGTVDASGNFSGLAPGTTWIVATMTRLGVTRRDSVRVTVVPGTFNGATAINAYGAAGLSVTFTQGAIPFDANTRVVLANDPGNSTLAQIDSTATTRQVLVPAGTAAGDTVTYFILNAGPNDATLRARIVAPSAVAPGNTTSAGAALLNLGEIGFGLIPGSRGEAVWYKVNITTPGTYRITFRWGDNQDKDAYVEDSLGTTLLALENGASANPETGTVTIAAPGTYYLYGSTWTPNPGAATAYQMSFVLVP